MKLLNNYLQELKSLSADSIISIDKVEFWLLKYQDEYNHLKYLREGELPPLPNDATAEDKFVDLYEKLDEASRYHKYEPYCKEQLVIYDLIKNDTEKLKKWLSTNEEFYYKELIHFSVNYLDYQGEIIHLKISSLFNKGLELFINKEDFKNTIQLLNLYESLQFK